MCIHLILKLRKLVISINDKNIYLARYSPKKLIAS